MMKNTLGRIRTVIAVAAVLYVLVLAVVWYVCTKEAQRKIENDLCRAEKNFQITLDGELALQLRFVSMTICRVLGDTCRPLPQNELQKLAEVYGIDELNIVDARGIVVGSSYAKLYGIDFREKEVTREYLKLLENPEMTYLNQPFRHGANNPEVFCKYYGMAFADKSGFLQVGLSYENFVRQIRLYSGKEQDAILNQWKFEEVGWYEMVPDNVDFQVSKRFVRKTGHGREYVRYFKFFTLRLAAVFPRSVFYHHRNMTMLIVALTLGCLSAFFVFFLLRREKISQKLAALHEQAAARNAADLALARKIQMSALPSPVGAFSERLEFWMDAISRPAREVGGDFYDFFRTPDGRIAMIVADVSGKGIPAAMFMMESKGVLRNCLVRYSDPAEAVAMANQQLCEANDAGMFTTAWIGLLNPQNGEMEYVNAGHNRPFLQHADGTVEKIIGKGGRFLGMFEGIVYSSHLLQLRKGDYLFLYTDGVTEAMNSEGKCFGEERLCRVFGKRGVNEALKKFVGDAEQSDDLTAMVLDWFGEPVHAEMAFPCGNEVSSQALDFLRENLTRLVDARITGVMLNAADEVIANIVSYSGAPEFRISVDCGVDRVKLSFEDGGKPYNPLTHVVPDVHAPLAQRPIGGLGLVIVRRLMDRVLYRRQKDRNMLILVKGIQRGSRG